MQNAVTKTLRIVRRQYIVSFSNMSLPLQTQDHAHVSAALGNCELVAQAVRPRKHRNAGARTAQKQVVCRAAAPDTPRTSPATAVH